MGIKTNETGPVTVAEIREAIRTLNGEKDDYNLLYEKTIEGIAIAKLEEISKGLFDGHYRIEVIPNVGAEQPTMESYAKRAFAERVELERAAHIKFLQEWMQTLIEQNHELRHKLAKERIKNGRD